MRKLNNQLIYSPSDLITFMDSRFDSWMERYHKEFPDEVRPDDPDESHEILAKHGNIHEQKYLEILRQRGCDIAEISRDDKDAAGSTIEAMRAGHEVIYQGYLSLGEFAGLSDFLFRVDGGSNLGDYHYEVWDTKLARKAKPYFVIQLCCYAEMLEQIQGKRPENIKVVLGDLSEKLFKVDEYFHVYAQLKDSFLEFESSFSKNTPPDDCTSGSFSRWSSYSEKILEERDDLSRVANIRKSQIERLRAAGITTLTELAQSEKDEIAKMSTETLQTLKRQARLQLLSKQHHTTTYETLPAVPGKGLSMLPPQSPNDVYFDMEGYPHMEGGLEYLFGASFESPDGELQFKDWWAHDRKQEKQAFEQFIDWVYERWQADPGMHIYHYAAYEVSAVKRLAQRHSTRVEHVDNLLRKNIFVDLYKVVRQGIAVGEPSYSIKYVEHLYREKRSGTVSKATDSVVFYENWLEIQDGDIWQESKILKDIRDYNEEDCVSTLQATQWLRQRQSEAGISYTGIVVESSPVIPEQSAAASLASELLVSAENLSDPEQRRVQELLAGVLEFHKREDKPMFWRLFDREEMTTQELFDDLDCLADLKRTDDPLIEIKKSFGHTYGFDPYQDTKLDVGSICYIATEADGLGQKTRISSIDRKSGEVTIVVGPSQDVPPGEISLIPDEFVDSSIISKSIYSVCEAWQRSGNIPRCLSDLLFRHEPRLHGKEKGANVVDSCHTQEIADAVTRMDHTCMSIQGPPGTGKTYTASHTILELLRQGKRVGISSNSHKAIENLLLRIVELAKSEDVYVRVAKVGKTRSCERQKDKKAAKDSTVRHFQSSGNFFGAKDLDEYNLIAGTAWLFSHENSTGMLDYLFVDEAGQVSLANVVGMSPSTKNLVLLGDQMQLEQPTQGTHPGDSGKSCLEYLLHEQATIPENMGIFLDTTRRMHPSICSLISDAVYGSRLKPDVANVNQVLVPPKHLEDLFDKTAGIKWIPVQHSNNAQASDEEVDAIKNLVDGLLQCQVADKHGNLKRVTMSDILIVAPYNMQVRKIAHAMPEAKVASVDKFQGQEAPIVILTMCASDANASPRGMDFLFNRNRLNVAISRAKSLAFVVGSPELLKTSCTSLKQMKLVSFFCQIAEAA